MKELFFGDKYSPVSDIACERQRACTDTDGVDFRIEGGDGFVWERLTITSPQGAKSIGRPIGRYDTINLPLLSLLGDGDLDEIQNEVAKELCLLTEGVGVYPGRILIAGLGNDRLCADSVGPRTARLIKQTRKIEGNATADTDLSEISWIAPGVSYECGIDSFEAIVQTAACVKADMVIAVDSIATSSTKRLGRCIQLSDTGIAPGSGIGGRRVLLNERSLGVPVIAVGAPTVINSKLLKLEGEGADELTGTELFITPRDIDALTDSYAKIISGAINQAFGIF